MDPKYVIAALTALVFAVVLFGLYHDQAHERVWGLNLILWTIGLVLLVGVGLRFKSALLPAWLGGGFLLAYLVGWRWLGGKCAGWKRHLVRAVVFAVCLGPLAEIPGSALQRLANWLGVYGRSPAKEILWTVIYGLPGLYLVGAVAFVASVVSVALEQPRSPTRGLNWTMAVLAVSLLIALNWYVAGAMNVSWAAYYGDDALLRYALLSRPGLVNCQGCDAFTPLHVAAAGDRADTVRLLLVHGADANAQVLSGKTALHFTALHFAAFNGHAATVRALLDAGADVNIRTLDGCTALHEAVRHGHTDAARKLLFAGADVNARDNTGDTVLDFAARWGVSRESGDEWLAEVSEFYTKHLHDSPSPEIPKYRSKLLALLHAAGAKTGKELDAEKNEPTPEPAKPEPGK